MAAVDFFEGLYKRREDHVIDKQLDLINVFPLMFDERDNLFFNRKVSIEEIKSVLKSLVVDKSLRPDGWNLEFFLYFYDVFCKDLTDMVEEARTNGRIEGTINSTFIALIPKRTGRLSFSDYRLISLCNTLYKIISKIVAERLKGTLSKFISPEQFGFMKHMNIHDIVVATQEILHTIQSKNLKAAVLKIDLNKAYDRVDWDFMRMVLHKIGLGREAVAWIMRCIRNTSLAVLINGSASKFFNPGRGLR